MQTIMKSIIFNDNTVVVTNPIPIGNEKFIEKTSRIDSNGIDGTNADTRLNGLHLVSRDIKISSGSYEMEIEHDFSFIKLHFEIEGDNRYTPDNTDELSIHIPSGHYNLFYLPKIKGNLRYDTKKRKTLEITFTAAYLKELFYPNFELTVPFLAEAIKHETAFTMWDTSKSISPKLYDLIEDILECKYEGKIKKTFLESKVVEILTHLFSLIIDNDAIEKTTKISLEDCRKIEAVENILQKDFKKKHTLKSLAIGVGLNDFKIKKYFKIIYKTTVFKYLTGIRMEYAKQYLIENDVSIALLSEDLGYKNPHHFTVAFKKHFGYLPSKIKN